MTAYSPLILQSGNLAQLPDGDTLRFAQNLQSTTKTDVFATNSTTFIDVPGLSVAIAPSSTSSKVFVLASLALFSASAGGWPVLARLARNGSPIAVGDAAGGIVQAGTQTAAPSGLLYFSASASLHTVDAPSTTATLTYSVQVQTVTASVSVGVNRTHRDSFPAEDSRMASALTCWEVSA